MRDRVDPEPGNHLRDDRSVDPPPADAREHQFMRLRRRAQLLRGPQHLDGPLAQRNPVLALRLHPLFRDRPHHRDHVDLPPRRQPDLGRAGRGQHQELERQPDALPGLGAAHLRESLADVAVRQGPPVPYRRGPPRERREQRIPRRVVGPVALGHRPLHDRADSVQHLPRRHVLARPQRQQHRHHVRRRHPVDGDAGELREGVIAEAALPLARGLAALAPAALVDREDLVRSLLERRDARGVVSAGRPRVAAIPCELAVGAGQLPGLGQRDGAEPSEAELPRPAPHHQPLDPAPGA